MKTVSCDTWHLKFCDNLWPSCEGKFHHYGTQLLCQCWFPGFDTICIYEGCYHWGKLYEVYTGTLCTRFVALSVFTYFKTHKSYSKNLLWWSIEMCFPQIVLEKCSVSVELIELQLQSHMIYRPSTCVGIWSQRSFGQWVNIQQFSLPHIFNSFGKEFCKQLWMRDLFAYTASDSLSVMINTVFTIPISPVVSLGLSL